MKTMYIVAGAVVLAGGAAVAGFYAGRYYERNRFENKVVDALDKMFDDIGAGFSKKPAAPQPAVASEAVEELSESDRQAIHGLLPELPKEVITRAFLVDNRDVCEQLIRSMLTSMSKDRSEEDCLAFLDGHRDFTQLLAGWFQEAIATQDFAHAMMSANGKIADVKEDDTSPAAASLERYERDYHVFVKGDKGTVHDDLHDIDRQYVARIIGVPSSDVSKDMIMSDIEVMKKIVLNAIFTTATAGMEVQAGKVLQARMHNVLRKHDLAIMQLTDYFYEAIGTEPTVSRALNVMAGMAHRAIYNPGANGESVQLESKVLADMERDMAGCLGGRKLFESLEEEKLGAA